MAFRGALQFGTPASAIYTAAQPAVGVLQDYFALPSRVGKVAVLLDWASAPTAPNLSIVGSMDGVNWTQVGVFTETVDTLKVFDFTSYRFISAIMTSITTPQNATLTVQLGHPSY